MIWKNIEGYRYPYRISEEAEIERQLPNGNWERVEPFLAFNGSKGAVLSINMCVFPRGRKRVLVTSLMEGRWLPPKKPGEFYFHKNGSAADCSARNLEIKKRNSMPWSKLGTNRRAVVKIDAEGNELEIYRSVTEAAKKNHLDRKSVSARCAGQIKRPFYLTGFSFKYESRDK